MLLFFLMVSLLLLSGMDSVTGDTIYVKAGSSGDGSSWANAYGDLQTGLVDADPGDEVWVAAGTYKPTNEVGGTGDRYKTFQMKNNVGIYGGFPDTGDPNCADRNPSQYETILSGDPNDNDEPVSNPEDLLNDPSRTDNCYHVFFHPDGNNLNSTAVLDGFTITGGNADGAEGQWPYYEYSGGGIYNGSSVPTVSNCIFRNNSAIWFGGGMCNNFCDNKIRIKNCTFEYNYGASGGGGMFNEMCEPIVTNCIFRNNVSANGGGIENYTSDPKITNCIFICNTAHEGGGIGFCECVANQLVTNCTFWGNSAEGYDGGGGVYSRKWSNPVLNNCILWGNTSTYGGTQIEGNVTVAYSNIQGGYPGVGNIDANPYFKEAYGADNIPGTEDDNLQLTYNSPCIDTGDNTAVPSDTTDVDGDGDTSERTPLDLAGHARFTNDPLTADSGVPDPPNYPAVVDMGAYERYEFCGDVNQAFKGDLNLDCYVNLRDFVIMSVYWQKNISCSGDNSQALKGDLDFDCYIDLLDLAVMLILQRHLGFQNATTYN